GKESRIDLKGNWRFCWNSLLSPDDFSEAPASCGTIRVPSVWTDAPESFPVYGYATYRLTVLLPENAPPLSLRIPPSDTAFTLFVNGEKIFSNGRVGAGKYLSKPLYYAPVRLELPRTSRIEIAAQMSNYDFPRPGMRDCISIGPSAHLDSQAGNYLAVTLFTAGAIFIMALYHFGLYYQRRLDRSNLYFALLCITTLSRLLVTGEACAYRIPWMSWEIGSKIEYLSIAIWAIALLFMRSFYPAEISQRIIKALFSVIAVLSAIVVFTPAAFFTRLLPVFDILSIFIIAYLDFILILAFMRKRESVLFFSAAFFVFAATVINDMLLGYRLIDSLYIMPYGLLLVFFLQSYLLSNKFSKAFTAVGIFSRNLEERVIERTMELEVERDKLKNVNLLMEKEIDL
ncbi:MAG: 7TM diverse intracellular signaling domain-containing protein, partial [Spirochaetota bacterium]